MHGLNVALGELGRIHAAGGIPPVVTLLIPLKGFLTFVLGGVRLHIDVENEDSYLEMEPGYDKTAMLALTALVDRLGFEVMDEYGAVEISDDGTIRNYIAQVWFPDENTAESGEEMSQAS